MIRISVSTLLAVLFILDTALAVSLSVGDCVEVASANVAGVPLHRDPANSFTGQRVSSGSIVEVEEISDNQRYFRVDLDGTARWIHEKYVVEKRPCDGNGSDLDEAGGFVVGTWNLEHFGINKTRGFPENTRGGPGYPKRTEGNYSYIASIIRDAGFKILVLQEIDGFHGDEGWNVSPALDKVVHSLPNFDYVLADSGGSQRIAILFDESAVRLNAYCETNFENTRVDGKGIFDRQPLIAHFTLMQGDTPMNDLAVVGVHLASGQHHTENHDTAMTLLRDAIADIRLTGECIPPDENDILIAGDFNANRFDNKVETLWTDFENDGWDVLGDDLARYSPTRLSGHPLKLRSSRIDYIIVSERNNGLSGEEIQTDTVVIHEHLIGHDAEAYRRQASDHIPVSVTIRVMEDTDSMLN